MPRDNDKNNGPSRGRPPGRFAGKGGGKGRSGAARGPEKKFAKRGFGGKSEATGAGGDRPGKSYVKKPHAGGGKPYAGKPYAAKSYAAKSYAAKPYADKRGDDRAPRPGERPSGATPKRFGDRKFGDGKFSRGAPDRGPRKDFGKDFVKDFGSRPERGRNDRGRDDRGPGRGPGRGESKPWQKRAAGSDRTARPPRDGVRNFDRPREDRPQTERPRVAGPKFERPRQDHPKFDRPRERSNSSWQEHPRNSTGGDRPRRANEDETKIFAKRPAFGGRGEYRARPPQDNLSSRRPRPPAPKKAGERVAKVVSRAGLCSRRDAEDWVTQGRVAVNGRIINSPALDVTTRDVITVDGKPLPAPERTRLFLFHKPRGLMTTHADPEGRPTVFDNLPEGLPRLISIGRLDFNTEGLLLLTNDGGLARTLELPDTGWLRRYRVRAHGEVTQAQLDALKNGVEVDGIKYGSIDARLERDQGANVWLVFAIREGKNREVRNVLAHLGLEVNRLIRISYGPFQLGELDEGQVEEVKTRVLREQLGEKIAAASGADFARQAPSKGDVPDDPVVKKPALKRSTVEDRKGRRVVVQRAGSDESRARHEQEAGGFGPPKRPKRGYHGKRDVTPRDE